MGRGHLTDACPSHTSQSPYEYSNLMSVVFCDEIKRIVFGESMLDWLNRGVHDHEKCLSTYLHFCPMQFQNLVHVLPRMWWSNIHDMLRGISSISCWDLESNFSSIDSKLSVYES